MIVNDNKKIDFESLIEPIVNASGSEGIDIFELNKNLLEEFIDDQVYLKSLVFILVQNGNGFIDVNFKKYQIDAQNVILLSVGHFFKFQEISSDFRCTILYVKHDYIEEMYSSEMIYKRVKYVARMFDKPLIRLVDTDFNALNKRLQFIQESLSDTKHLYQKELILLSLQVYFLDLSSIVETEMSADPEKYSLSRDEVYFQSFLELLANHYQTEHLVEFYANQLNISTHYLTVIIKRLTDKTVSDFVYQLIFGDAKLLLKNPALSIKEISEQLNFSDQSAFGKFFKRKSGMSPLRYKKKSV